jgi:alkylation response protein AidB-like acyl-CoA dehydrogenase
MMDAAERALFTDTIGRTASERSGRELDAALGELGWMEALAADRATAVAVLFEAMGRSNASSSALDVVLASALGTPHPGANAVVLPPLRTVEAPGRHDGGQITVVGLGTRALAHHDTAVIVVKAPDSTEALVVPAPALKVEPTHGLDPALGLVEVSGEFDPASLPEPSSVDWADVVAVGQLCLGHELVGGGRTMLELARRHALERVQFGRPISSFQAVRHRLAESLVALDAADALLAAAWEVPGPDPTLAAMAKALAGRSVRTVARHCQQVLAGIGFTTEHDLHRFVRRTLVLDQLFGAGGALTRRLGAEVLATKSLPASLPL